MSTEDRIWFEQWKAEFSNALAGTAASGDSAEAIVSKANNIAAHAVALIRERAAEADAKP